MTCIVKGIVTKKQLKEIIATGNTVTIEDPSIVAPFRGTLDEYMRTNRECFLTNHPTRSWFAHVFWKNGDLRVE